MNGDVADVRIGREMADASRGATTDRRALARLVVLWVVCVVGLAAVYGLAVRTELGQRVDDGALEGRRIERPGALDAAQDVLDTISVSSLALAGGAVVLVGVARGRWRLGGAAGVVILGANVTTQVLKYDVLSRPRLLDETLRLQNTLPSGHTTVAMSLVVAAVLVVPRRYRGTVAFLGVVYAVCVSAAVLVAGWHRPSDAIAAAFVAVGWGAGGAAVLVGWRGAGPDDPGGRPGEPRPLAWVLTVAGAGLLLAGAGVAVLVAYLANRSELVLVDRGLEFAWGLIVIAGIELLAIGLLLVALRGVSLDAAPPGREGRPPA